MRIATIDNLSRAQRTILSGPVACGCLLIGGAAYVAAIDPVGPGVHLPACPLHEMTGLWCPACGLTRAAHALLRGHVATAFGDNVLFPLFFGAIIVGWSAWVRAAAGRTPIRWLTRLRPWTGGAVVVTLIAFTVLRNLPSMKVLAP